MHCNFVISVWVFYFHTLFKRPWYLNLDTILPSQIFISFRFYSILASLFYYSYHTSHIFCRCFFSFRLCIILRHPFRYLSPSSVSPLFSFPLLCLSIIYAYNLSFLILQSHHFILSLLFSNFSIPNHHI